MNNKFIEASEYIAKAREALRRGDRESARQLAERAALLAPNMEDVWLVFAASDPNPQDALAYARKALEINPESTRGRQGVEWALGKLKQVHPEPSQHLHLTQGQVRTGNARVERSAALTGEAVSKGRNEAMASLPKRAYRKSITFTELKPPRQSPPYAVLFAVLACAVIGFAAYSAVTHPAFASIVNSAPVPTQEKLWAYVDIAKPTLTPIGVSVIAAQVADTPTLIPTSAPTDVPTLSLTDTPTSIPTEAPTLTSEATETPGTLAMEIVPDTPTGQYVQPDEGQANYPSKGNGARWVDVDLSEQRVYAYEGDVIVNSFLVSTGTWQTPTVTGKYKIYIKVRSQALSGPGYYLPNVPYVMFFYEGYGFHGTYWHNNFGTPMSRGCVNLTIPDAEWLYNWASVGTVVNVHY